MESDSNTKEAVNDHITTKKFVLNKTFNLIISIMLAICIVAQIIILIILYLGSADY